MKRILLYIALLTITFAACEPIEDRDSMSGELALKDLKLTATPIQIDGLNTNEVVVENNSSTLSRWVSDRTQVESAYATVLFDYTGSREVQFYALNGNGTKLETTLPVQVDTMTNLTSSMISRLGIKYNEDGSLNKNSKPYFLGKANYTLGTDYNITLVQDEKDGLKGNKITFDCEAPYLCHWTMGTSSSDNNKGSISVYNPGTYTLSLSYTKADGTVIENAFEQEFVVEELTDVPDALKNLFGDFLENPDVSKTWQWSRDGKVWANGPLRGFTDPGSGWWQNAYADMTGRQDGTMTFKFSDLSLTKEVTAADENVEGIGTHSGTLKYDLSGVDGYSIGHLYLNGITILYGIDVNAGNVPFTSLSIISVTKKTLILGGDSDDTGQTWLYKFEAVEE
nr:hypothetical protein [uncultured Carboxylicivirga sp.]